MAILQTTTILNVRFIDAVMFKADLRPLCTANMMINVSYTDIMNSIGREPPPSTHKGLLTVRCTLNLCITCHQSSDITLIIIKNAWSLSLHLLIRFFASICNLTGVCSYNGSSMLKHGCTEYNGNLSALEKVYRHYARICLEVTSLAWAQNDGPVSSVLLASHTGSIDFGADALL